MGNSFTGKPRRLGRLRRDEQGATIVEFAIVLIPLLMVIMGGLDLGYQAYVRSVVQGALNDVARSGSLEAPAIDCDGDTVEERVGCAIEQRSEAIALNAEYDIDMKSYFDFSSVGRSEKLVTDYNNNGQYDAGDCFSDLNENGEFDESAGREGLGGADDVVFYQVTLTQPRIMPLAGLLGFSPNYEITAQTALRNQPYTRQRTPPTVCA